MERHEDIQAQLADYALGDLPVAARDRIRAHLDGCAECAAEARDLSLAFHGIGLALDPVTPPAHLRARVLENLDRETPAGGGRQPARLPEARQSRGWHPAWLAVAAAAVLALAGLLAASQQRAATLREDLRRVEADTAQLRADAETIARQADLAVAILTAPDMRRIDLQGFDRSRNATARAYWSTTKGLLIVADRLPQPPSGRTYQVWLIEEGGSGPVSAGLIDGDAGGRGMLIVPPPDGVAGRGMTVAVTDEPRGGLPAPTGAKHLAGSL